jgi:nitrous oxidase accessory protein
MRIRLFILCILFVCRAEARVLKVGKNMTYETIGAAVKTAQENDSVWVYPGVYAEGNIIITRPLHLIGINNPVLDGQGKYEILTISTKNVVITGFTLRNAGTSVMRDFAAVKIINAQNITLSHCIIQNAYFAIHCANSSQFTIRNNTITGQKQGEQNSGNGIHLWKCSGALIENNRVTGHRDGIYFEFVTGSLIRGNNSSRNIRYGLHFMFSHNDSYIKNTFKHNGAGVAVMYSHGVTMEENHFEENWGASAYGILLKDITDSHIRRNHFLKNTSGLFMEGSSRTTVENNIFKNNGWALRVQSSCTDNRFTQNNFFSNSFDAATNGSLVLNTFDSNYWDKYKGYDLNRDGRGDIPYYPVTLYSVLVEKNPFTLILMNSFMVSLMDEAERALPTITPEHLADKSPLIKPVKL